MILTTKVGELWIVETETPTDNPVGSTIVDEGTIAGVDRLRADWDWQGYRTFSRGVTPNGASPIRSRDHPMSLKNVRCSEMLAIGAS